MDCLGGLGKGVVQELSPFRCPFALKKVLLQFRKMAARIAPPLKFHISQVESIQQIESFPMVVSTGSESPPLQR